MTGPMGTGHGTPGPAGSCAPHPCQDHAVPWIVEVGPRDHDLDDWLRETGLFFDCALAFSQLGVRSMKDMRDLTQADFDHFSFKIPPLKMRQLQRAVKFAIEKMPNADGLGLPTPKVDERWSTFERSSPGRPPTRAPWGVSSVPRSQLEESPRVREMQAMIDERDRTLATMQQALASAQLQAEMRAAGKVGEEEWDIVESRRVFPGTVPHPKDQDGLRAWLQENRLFEELAGPLFMYGVRTMEDLKEVNDGDLAALQAKIPSFTVLQLRRKLGAYSTAAGASSAQN
eukprot:CAMPEP_0180213898 /NCGR_PEP_ID=MMETSP0987-20121128/14529_1 /TAXON_ID=697907 /ORGANISM="non described non described, Strain CCMP2293" /LENGTH=285 /DNA_ID=CAMNT_0022172163 /DNA_START=114 /DNA_END=968 /DNA_ORIENTATION=-